MQLEGGLELVGGTDKCRSSYAKTAHEFALFTTMAKAGYFSSVCVMANKALILEPNGRPQQPTAPIVRAGDRTGAVTTTCA